MTLPYDRVGDQGELVPGCDQRRGTDVFRAEIERRFKFTFLGACSIRTTAGGTRWSIHAVKRAVDFGYADRQCADQYLDYLTERGGARAKILGIQALHDYAVGEDGSYGTNHPSKRMWGHGRAEWRFGSLGNGWFWTHTELLYEVASNGAEMERRFAQLNEYDRALEQGPSRKAPNMILVNRNDPALPNGQPNPNWTACMSDGPFTSHLHRGDTYEQLVDLDVPTLTLNDEEFEGWLRSTSTTNAAPKNLTPNQAILWKAARIR